MAFWRSDLEGDFAVRKGAVLSEGRKALLMWDEDDEYSRCRLVLYLVCQLEGYCCCRVLSCECSIHTDLHDPPEFAYGPFVDTRDNWYIRVCHN